MSAPATEHPWTVETWSRVEERGFFRRPRTVWFFRATRNTPPPGAAGLSLEHVNVGLASREAALDKAAVWVKDWEQRWNARTERARRTDVLVYDVEADRRRWSS